MLRDNLVDTPETITEFLAAAEDRYWEALSLVTEGFNGGGIYLMGYVAEMLLKAAYFSLRGEPLTSDIVPMLSPAWRRGCDYFPQSFTPGSRDYHNLDFWARLLREERRRQGKPLLFHMDLEFQSHAGRLYSNWWVEMRYRRDVASLPDAEVVLDSVNWLRQHFAVLAT